MFKCMPQRMVYLLVGVHLGIFLRTNKTHCIYLHASFSWWVKMINGVTWGMLAISTALVIWSTSYTTLPAIVIFPIMACHLL